MIDPAAVDRLRARADAVRSSILLSSIVGRAVALRRAGREWDGLCPFHADKRIGAFKVNDDKALFKCFACGATGDVIDFVERHLGLRFIEALEQLERGAGIDAAAFADPARVRENEAARAARDKARAADDSERQSRAARLWLQAVAIAATPAAAYLATRGIEVARLNRGRWPSSLRYRPDLWCGELADRGLARDACKLPGLVAGIWRIDRGSSLVGCHRTFLDIADYDHAMRGGVVRKAVLTDAKLTLGPSIGGYIPINKGRHAEPLASLPAGAAIFVSEGIEDALSVAMAEPDQRIIAGVSLSKLAALMLPPQCRELILIAQRDPIGSAAADAFERATAAHQMQGRRVRHMWPPEGYKDFNDVLTGKVMTAPANPDAG